MNEKRTELGLAIEEAFLELAAWKRGEATLEARTIEPMPKERIKAIRKKVARSTRAFEARFGIPAATMNNWEQGRRTPDLDARLLLRVIEAEPTLVEQLVHP